MSFQNHGPVLTNHARCQAQVRGIPLHVIESIYRHADSGAFVGSGCRSLMVSKRRIGELAGVICLGERERMAGVILVIDHEANVVITVMHSYGSKSQRYRRQRHGHPHRSRRPH